MPSVAGLFQIADCAASDQVPSGETSISLEHAKRAAALCDYLEAHARRVYACIVSPEARSARELIRHVQAGDLPEKFSTREVYRHAWAGLDTPERVRGAISFLEELGWLRRFESPGPPASGRPSEIWLANPGVGRA